MSCYDVKAVVSAHDASKSWQRRVKCKLEYTLPASLLEATAHGAPPRLSPGVPLEPIPNARHQRMAPGLLVSHSHSTASDAAVQDPEAAYCEK